MSIDTSLGPDIKQGKIPEVRFNLKSHKKGNTSVLIVGMFRYEGNLLRYTTQRHIDPKWWNKTLSRSKESVNYPDGANINQDLDIIRDTIRLAYKEKFLGTNVNVSDLRLEVDYRLGRKSRPKPKKEDHKDFMDYLEYEIEKNKVRVNGLKGGQTWQKYESLKRRIEKYMKATGFEPAYENFTNTFKDDLILWLEKKELSQNTISKDIETIKTILKRSSAYHSNLIYNGDDFKLNRIKTTEHYPTLEELKELFNYEFENKSYQKVVDLYLISAFGGGLRISDILRLNKDHEGLIEDSKFLVVYTFKGRDVKEDTEVVIPFTPQLQQLIDKYDWELPRFTEQYINDTLKNAFAKAGLDRKKLMKSGVKGKNAKKRKLCDVVHFHTARYAYIDYMMNDLGVSAEELRKITGQSLKVLLGYERGDKKKNAVKVQSKIYRQLQGLRVVKNEAI